MKILLIRPAPAPETIGLQHVMICEPLELEYLCAVVGDLPHGTTVLDMILEKEPVETLLARYQPDLVAVTAYITHVGIAREYCRIAKKIRPTCRTVVGGVHAEVVPGDFVDPAVDFIVCANPLRTFRALVEALAAGQGTASIPGLWRPGAQPPAKDAHFDYPFPDRSKVAQYRSRYYYLFHNPCALMKTSYGCPQQCTFCFCREVTDGQYFERRIDDVIAELKTIPERDIYIVDDNMLVSRGRVLEFCRQLRRERLQKKFLIYGRADFIAANEDVMAEFKACGLRAVIVGLESCRSCDLDRFNKRVDVETNERAVRILARHDIDCYGTLILGRDWVRADFDELYRWLRKLDLTFVNLQPFTPLPGTALFREYQSELLVPREDYPRWDLAHWVIQPTGMSTRAYYWNIVRLYYRVTMRPAHVVRLLRRHGLRENLKMLAGSTRVTWQYLKRVRGGA